MIYLTDNISEVNKHDLAIYGIASLLVYHPQDVHRLLEQKYNTQVPREQLLDTVNQLLYDSYEFRLDIAELIREKGYIDLESVENNGEYSNFLCIGGKRLGIFTSEECELKQELKEELKEGERLGAEIPKGDGFLSGLFGKKNGEDGARNGFIGTLIGGLVSSITSIFGGGGGARLESEAQIEKSRNELTEAVLELEKEKVKQRGAKALIIGGIAVAVIVALALIFRRRK